MFQFIVLLAIANATQAVPLMAELPVKVGPLPNNTGTYVELRNRIALMSAEWTIISYFYLRLLAQEITAFKKILNIYQPGAYEAGHVQQQYRCSNKRPASYTMVNSYSIISDNGEEP